MMPHGETPHKKEFSPIKHEYVETRRPLEFRYMNEE